ncbi:MarR family transcriptional regulator [Rhizobiales bacterium RZME27]|uniref:MarR family transcriptional regulator n=1 Tax=Endobacterium cereale TaxID=2663029 RepID=A0A6A8AIK6_9HYPH|nr:MarR family transcriptional regulator [Endobacterium cereale]MEB2843089.1 MarR family transcriptional regulator [Endobacterium cereale]MQY49657.1 MarR family transcriptional regulator [Endobacterium cereale]
MSSNVRDNFGNVLGQASRQWRRALDLRLRPFGLTDATWLPLLQLSRAGVPMRQKDLAEALFLDSSSVVRLLDALQASGFIERREHPEDRRVKTIILTDAAQEVLANVEQVTREVRHHVLSGLTDEELEVASRVMRNISAALDQPEPEDA